VNLCIDIHTKQKYAMKILTKKQFQKKLFRKHSVSLAENYIANEIAILKKMNHPFIIKLYEVIEDEQKDKMYLVLEYCSAGFIN
jgi:serine/threonine protein kinase